MGFGRIGRCKYIPTKREIASVLQLVVAFLCYLNRTKWEKIGNFPDDVNIFILWPKVSILFYVSVLFGASTWLFHSFNRLTKLCMRLFVIVYYVVSALDLMSSTTAIKKPYEGEMLFENIERACWDDEFFEEIDSAISGVTIIPYVMIPVVVILVYLELRGIWYFIKNLRNRNDSAV